MRTFSRRSSLSTPNCGMCAPECGHRARTGHARLIGTGWQRWRLHDGLRYPHTARSCRCRTSVYAPRKVLTMRTILLLLNLLVSLASAVAAVIALIRPASFSGSSHVVRGEIFYVRMYAARSIPFGLAAGILPFWRGGPAVAWVLFTAAVIQIVDVVIAVGKKERGMMIGASVGAIVHLLSGIRLIVAGNDEHG
jgi:hypothetical protein